jgi:hypothetical protein
VSLGPVTSDYTCRPGAMGAATVAWQKPATAHSAQAGTFKRRIRLNWIPAVDLDALMGVLETSAMRRIVCLCFWAPGTQPPTASACPLALGPFTFFHCPPALATLQWCHSRPSRRRNLEASDECPRIYFVDVRVGTIVIRTGTHTTPIRRNRGAASIRARIPREHQSGTAATFD